MNRVVPVYRLLNILSIDVAVGAVICALFFARIFEVQIKPYGLISLGLTVWIIYTADHLLDALKTQQIAATKRHQFHQQHFKILCVVMIVAIIIDALQILFIRKPIIVSGLSLAALVVIYFFVQRHVNYVKEFFGAILYSSGVLLAPLSLVDKPLTTFQWMIMIQFFITALINLLLFSMFDNEYDLKDKHQSFTTSFGLKATQTILVILFIINAAFVAIQLKIYGYVIPIGIILVMNFILFVILAKRKYFDIDDRYRLLGDAVFFIPIVYLF